MDLGQFTSLATLCVWIITGGGAGIAAYWIMDRVQWLVELQSEKKVYAAWAISAGLAWVAFFLLGYVANVWAVIETGAKPVGWQQWFMTLFSVGMAGIISSQKVHAQRDLRNRGVV